MSDDLLKPGSKIKPLIDIDSATKLIENWFNFKVIKINEIDSYDDRNYFIEIESNYREYGTQFVLKITNSLDTSITGLIEAINEVTDYTKSTTNLKVPYPITDSEGKSVSRVKLDSSDQSFAVRLLSFVPGTIMNKVSYTEDILFQAGEMVANLTIKLKNFSNSVLKTRQTIWSLLSLSELGNFVFAIDNEHHRSLISDVIMKFKRQVLDAIDKFPVSVIHGDLNEQNIVLEKGTNGDNWSIIGVIDFGDSHCAPTIFDLAILCCYITLDSQLIDPIDAPRYVISGYQSIIQINEQEWDILPICIMARLAQSLTLGAYSFRNDPENEYILSSAKKGWTMLEKLASHDCNQLKEKWQNDNRHQHQEPLSTA